MNYIENKLEEDAIRDSVAGWVLSGFGDFSVNDIYKELKLYDQDEMRVCNETLEEMLKTGDVQRIGSRRGWYRRVDKRVQVIDWRNAETREFPLRMPFKLHHQVKIFPKSIIAISGEKNVGKTAVCLNLVKLNQNRGYQVDYYSSEMLGPEFKVRLEAFDDVPIDAWKFRAIHRTQDFADVINPDAINIIDFLEIYDQFWKIGKYITEIFNKLKNGVAIVCVQKSGGSEHGRGGSFLIEKPRLTLNLSRRFNEYGDLDGATLKCTNAKFPRDPYNPNGKSIDYKTVNGCKLQTVSEWYYSK
jgi:hypothetical protein